MAELDLSKELHVFNLITNEPFYIVNDIVVLMK
jgi:hypothetical protein